MSTWYEGGGGGAPAANDLLHPHGALRHVHLWGRWTCHSVTSISAADGRDSRPSLRQMDVTNRLESHVGRVNLNSVRAAMDLALQAWNAPPAKVNKLTGVEAPTKVD